MATEPMNSPIAQPNTLPISINIVIFYPLANTNIVIDNSVINTNPLLL